MKINKSNKFAKFEASKNLNSINVEDAREVRFDENGIQINAGPDTGSGCADGGNASCNHCSSGE